MILVDTSVWIEVLRGRARDQLIAATAGDTIVTCLPVTSSISRRSWRSTHDSSSKSQYLIRFSSYFADAAGVE